MTTIRPIRFDQFKKQLEEVGIGNLQPIELSKDETIYIRLGNSIDADDTEEFTNKLMYAEDSKAAALIILGYYPGATAEEQWEKFEAVGGTADQLATLFAAATTDQQEKLGKLRPKRS
mgnify:CR=1 FL=1